jgi:hypothetical protein
MLVSDQGAALLNQQVYSSGAPPPVGLNNEWMCSPAHCIGNSCGPICRGPRILASFPFIILLMLLLHCGVRPFSPILMSEFKICLKISYEISVVILLTPEIFPLSDRSNPAPGPPPPYRPFSGVCCR